MLGVRQRRLPCGDAVNVTSLTFELQKRASLMRSTFSKILVGLLALVLLLAVVGYLSRNTLANHLATLAIDRSPKLHCTEPNISIGAALDRVSIGEIECTMSEGPLRYAHVEGNTEVELSMFKPTFVHVEKVTIDQRDRDVSHIKADTMGDMAEVTGLADVLYKGMLDFSELYSPTAPPILVDKLTMTRAGKKEAVLQEFRKTADGDWDRCRAPRVEAPGIAKLVALRELDMRVMPSRGLLKAGVYLDKKPEPGEKPDIAVAIEGERLDGKHPKFEFTM